MTNPFTAVESLAATNRRKLSGEMFRGKVRYFRPERESGLAVIDLPQAVTTALGGLKQIRVRGNLNGVRFTSNVMPAGKGVLALSVSRAMLTARCALHQHRGCNLLPAGDVYG